MPDPTTPIVAPPASANGAAAAAAPAAEDATRKAREAEIKATGAKLKADKDALNKQRGEINAQLKQLEAERAALKPLQEIKPLWDQRLKDPNAFMTKAFSEKWRDDFAKVTTGDATPFEIQQLREQLQQEIEARHKEKDDAAKQADADKATAAKTAAEREEKVFNEYAQEMNTTWIKKHEADFPTIAASGLGWQVAVDVRALHKNGGKVGEVEYKPGDVPDEMLVAKALEERLDKLLDGVYATPKWSEKLRSKFATPPVERKKESALPFQYVPRKAISADMAASGAAKEQHKPLTREERKARLMGKTYDPETGSFK